jgi:hypothetical protein
MTKTCARLCDSLSSIGALDEKDRSADGWLVDHPFRHPERGAVGKIGTRDPGVGAAIVRPGGYPAFLERRARHEREPHQVGREQPERQRARHHEDNQGRHNPQKTARHHWLSQPQGGAGCKSLG